MYSVPIVPPDLRHEETIIQAAFALDCLNKTINSIFDKIDRRIETNNVKVKSLGERINKAQEKIKGLVGTKKAIKLYAPSRFPASHIFQDIPTTFANGSVDEIKNSSSTREYKIQSKPEVLQSPQEKLVFFHVRSKEQSTINETSIMQNRKGIEQRIKKGIIDKSLRSVSSILLFDSDECVYEDKNKSTEEPLNSGKYFKKQKDHSGLSEAPGNSKKLHLEPPPASLINRNQNRYTPAGDLRYMPRSTEAPEIDLPMDLPDLPGIADDIHYENKEKQQIAPSLFCDNLPDLEELEAETKGQSTKDESTHIPNAESKKVEKNDGSVKSSPAVVPPPPPPPPQMVAPKTQVTSTAGPPVPPPPPPPVEPPPSPLNSRTSSNNESKAIHSKPPTDNINKHANLMEEIRKSGGTQGGLLKRISDSPEGLQSIGKDGLDFNSSKSSKSNANSGHVGNDLMMDLHNKLQMRRKGISGNNITNKQPDVSMSPMMNRLSSLIPPPLQKEEPNNKAEDDDIDWTE